MDMHAGSMGDSTIGLESQVGVAPDEKNLLRTSRLQKTPGNAISGIRQSENRQEILPVVRASERFTEIYRIAATAE